VTDPLDKPDTPHPLDKRLLFVTGKGGVGKTTVSAALALAAAERGKRTIVCEVARQERMSRAFRREGVGFSETELAERFWAISIDPEDALFEYLQEQIGSRRIANFLFHNRIFEYLAAAAPGVRELATIGKVWELSQLERRNPRNAPYDLVIVDAPATGHGVGMLRTPRTFRDIARVGPIARQAGRIDAYLRDRETTGVVAVALPEEMPVTETIELRGSLGEQVGLDFDAVVVNGLYPERFGASEAERLESLNGAGLPEAREALRAAIWEHRQAREQRAQLRRLQQGVDTDVVTLPFLFEPELGIDSFERLAGELGSRL
jgi:anion-transporting  ArsA/GET3 family ATPase